MSSKAKTEQQLIDELNRARERIAEFKASEVERQRAEKALRQSEERYRTFMDDVLDSSAIGIFILDANFRVVWVNQAMERFFGFQRGEVLGKDKRKLVVERIKHIFEAPDTFSGKVLATYDDNTYVESFECHVLPEGEREERWLHHWSQPIRSGLYAGGRIEHYSDITELKRAEADLRESEGKYRTLLENLPQKIFLKDRNSVYISCNENYARDLRIKPDEIAGKNDYEFFPEDLAEKYRGDDSRLMESGETEHLEERYIQDGQERWVHTVKTPVRDEAGNATGILGVFWDITQRKRTEEALREVEEQLRQAQKMEAVGRLAGGIAHDFNNLLTAITGYSEMMLSDMNSADPNRELLEEISRAGHRAASLTRQLLAFSRKQILKPEVLDVNQVVVEMEKMLRRVIGEDVKLATSLDPNLGSVRVDRGQMEQVIMNLAVNARDAMPTGGRLTIETAHVRLDEEYANSHADATPGPHVMLAMSDTGFGMDRETQAKIFEPFFTTKKKGEGTGLGLSTVYGIVKQSGGNIYVYSEPGIGTSFKVYFPRVPEGGEAVRDERVPSEPGAAAETEPARESVSLLATDEKSGRMILVVDDDQAVRKLAVSILNRNGYAVLEAGGGKEALAVCGACEHPIHLVITDVVMKDMGGRELSHQLRAVVPGAKTLYTLGYAFVEQAELDPGMQFLQKPFTAASLLAKVREVLGEPQAK